jgi:ribonuclease III
MKAIEATVRGVEAGLGWKFVEPAWLIEALTHSTYANEHPDAGPANERLEFLGDAVIDLLAARLLFSRFRDAPEGELTRRRARVVRRAALAAMARELALGDALRLGEGQKKSGIAPSRILADTFEAVVGAVFMDGGFGAVETCFAEKLGAAIERATDPVDFKTLLQEEGHRRDLGAPVYRVVDVSGPDHARRYTCELSVGGRSLAQAVASNKKTAEQECAKAALAALEAS